MACGSSNSGGPSGTGSFDASNGSDAPTLVGDNETIVLNPGDGGGVVGDSAFYNDVLVIPEGFVPTEFGGYALGPPTTGAGSDAGIVQNGSSSNCSLVVGIVRDFASYLIQDGGHPDFERFSGSAATLGLVQKAIGTDRKPVYGAECDDNGSPSPPCLYGQQMTTQANFDEWYRFTPDVNAPYLVYLQFVPNGNVYTFESTNYFPLDNAGFGNTPGVQPQLQLHHRAAPEVHVQRRRDVLVHRRRRSVRSSSTASSPSTSAGCTSHPVERSASIHSTSSKGPRTATSSCSTPSATRPWFETSASTRTSRSRTAAPSRAGQPAQVTPAVAPGATDHYAQLRRAREDQGSRSDGQHSWRRSRHPGHPRAPRSREAIGGHARLVVGRPPVAARPIEDAGAPPETGVTQEQLSVGGGALFAQVEERPRFGHAAVGPPDVTAAPGLLPDVRLGVAEAHEAVVMRAPASDDAISASARGADRPLPGERQRGESRLPQGQLGAGSRRRALCCKRRMRATRPRASSAMQRPFPIAAVVVERVVVRVKAPKYCSVIPLGRSGRRARRSSTRASPGCRADRRRGRPSRRTSCACRRCATPRKRPWPRRTVKRASRRRDRPRSARESRGSRARRRTSRRGRGARSHGGRCRRWSGSSTRRWNG